MKVSVSYSKTRKRIININKEERGREISSAQKTVSEKY